MYEITCDDCGRVGVHPSRVGAELQADHHTRDTDHACRIEPMELA
jgi:hypothetical protein